MPRVSTVRFARAKLHRNCHSTISKAQSSQRLPYFTISRHAYPCCGSLFAPKLSGTLDSSSFSRLYENLLLVRSKSFPITSAHSFLCTRNCRRVTNVAEC